MPKNETTVIAVRKSTDLAALDELDRILRTGVAPTEQVETDPDEIHRQIVAELLDAATDDELENVGSATPWQEMEGIPVTIQGFRWRPSEYKEGPPVFCVVFANRVDDGGRVVLTTGSAGVMAQLANLAKRERLPGAIRKLVRAEKPSKGGFYPLRLVTPDGVTNEPTPEPEAA
jgi:hypothetical protein